MRAARSSALVGACSLFSWRSSCSSSTAPAALKTIHEDAHEILTAALKAADPRGGIKRAVRLEGETLCVQDRTYPLDEFDKVIVVGAGKASAHMADAIQEILGDKITGGVIVTKYAHSEGLKLLAKSRIEVVEASHPVPDAMGVKGSKKILQLAKDTCSPRTLLLCCISGGGSALMSLPADGLTLADLQQVNSALLACGATIDEMNVVRKHLSSISGGQLARAAATGGGGQGGFQQGLAQGSLGGSMLVSLVLSDVVGDPLPVIASGPTVPDDDASTFEHALEVLAKYDICDALPAAAMAHLRQGVQGQAPETPKLGGGAGVFDKCQTVMVGTNRQAMAMARAAAERLGYNVLQLSSLVEGEAREVAKVYAAVAKEVVQTGNPIPAPCCIIAGGETTVTLTGSGKGGRNQELALSAAIELAGTGTGENIGDKRVVFLSAGTDGTDGPTDAAGAIVDGLLVTEAEDKGLKAAEYMKNSDAYNYFDKLGRGLIMTGPTGTNVMDIALILVK